jgi:zinc/manganese transport system substrate-binding protein
LTLAKVWYVGILLMLVNLLTPLISYSSGSTGLTIIATFPNLVDDINLIKCDLDKAYSLLPPSVDPHDYSLTPADIELLKQADLIVSTSHTHFESRISELRNRGDIKAVIVEIPKIPGIRLLQNPSTGLPNLHMPIYDPSNYLIFLRNLTDTLKRLNPACSDVYEAKYELVRENITKLLNSVERLSLRGVGVKPVVQYAVTWVGINITNLLVPEEGVSPTPKDVSEIDELVRGGRVDVIVVTAEEDTYVSYLRSLGTQYGVPVLVVPLPFTEGSVISKLEEVVEQLANLEASSTTTQKPGTYYPNNTLLLVLLGSASSLLLALLIYRVVRVRGISSRSGSGGV